MFESRFLQFFGCNRLTRIAEAVLAYESLQNQEELVVIPWTVLQTQYGPNPEDRYIILDIESQRVRKAPLVTRSQWPQVVYSEWTRWQPKFDAYYKVEVERKHKKNKETIKVKEKN